MYAVTPEKRKGNLFSFAPPCLSSNTKTTVVTLWLMLANYSAEHSTHLHTHFTLHDLGTTLPSLTATLDNSLCHIDLQWHTHEHKAVIEDEAMQGRVNLNMVMVSAGEVLHEHSQVRSRTSILDTSSHLISSLCFKEKSVILKNCGVVWSSTI